MEENLLTEKILGCAFKVHSALGAGLLESAYEKCLAYELSLAGIDFEKQNAMPLFYEDVKLDCGYRLDFLVEKKVVVEIKSVEKISDLHLAQVITYLKLSDCKVGLILNFNTKSLRDGIKRVIY